VYIELWKGGFIFCEFAHSEATGKPIRVRCYFICCLIVACGMFGASLYFRLLLFPALRSHPLLARRVR